jgi:hypothetical protein
MTSRRGPCANARGAFLCLVGIGAETEGVAVGILGVEFEGPREAGRWPRDAHTAGEQLIVEGLGIADADPDPDAAVSRFGTLSATTEIDRGPATRDEGKVAVAPLGVHESQLTDVEVEGPPHVRDPQNRVRTFEVDGIRHGEIVRSHAEVCGPPTGSI